MRVIPGTRWLLSFRVQRRALPASLILGPLGALLLCPSPGVRHTAHSLAHRTPSSTTVPVKSTTHPSDPPCSTFHSLSLHSTFCSPFQTSFLLISRRPLPPPKGYRHPSSTDTTGTPTRPRPPRLSLPPRLPPPTDLFAFPALPLHLVLTLTTTTTSSVRTTRTPKIHEHRTGHPSSQRTCTTNLPR